MKRFFVFLTLLFALSNSSQNSLAQGNANQTFLFIRGAFVLLGKQPDGDSVRFIPDKPESFKQLQFGYRIRPSKVDKSVQLRFEAVDAPELHYADVAQPRGDTARDYLLNKMGFTNIVYDNNTVSSSKPERLRGAILSRAAETNGRPVSYVLLDRDTRGLQDGKRFLVSDNLLKRTLNYGLLESGEAYFTVYSSQPDTQRKLLRSVALAARNAKRGVWQTDATSNFILANQASIGPNGALVLPKIFRRATDYLRDKNSGKFSGTLPEWIQWVTKNGHFQDDLVRLANNSVVNLSELLTQTGDNVKFGADILDIVFIEK